MAKKFTTMNEKARRQSALRMFNASGALYLSPSEKLLLGHEADNDNHECKDGSCTRHKPGARRHRYG